MCVCGGGPSRSTFQGREVLPSARWSCCFVRQGWLRMRRGWPCSTIAYTRAWLAQMSLREAHRRWWRGEVLCCVVSGAGAAEGSSVYFRGWACKRRCQRSECMPGWLRSAVSCVCVNCLRSFCMDLHAPPRPIPQKFTAGNSSIKVELLHPPRDCMPSWLRYAACGGSIVTSGSNGMDWL